MTRVREDINAFSHCGPNNESHLKVLALGCLYKVHLWQFLESRWFGLASVPSSVSFECLLHNVSWLESLLSWGSSRKDFGSSEWRWMSAVLPTVVKKCPAKATHVYFGSRFKGTVHHGWEDLANVPLHLQSEAQHEEVWCSIHSIFLLK